MFFKLEQLYIQSVVAEVPCTQVQMLEQALDKIKKMGLFTNSVKEWNTRNPNDKNWRNMKTHFIRACDAHLESGPTTNTAGYHGAAATLSDDNSLGSITNSITQMNMANNANIRAMNESMSTANAELRQALVGTQQQVAASARHINQNNQAPAL